MSLEKRIQALEARLIADPVVLCFAAGSKRELRGWGDFLLRLFQGAFGGADLSPGQAEELDLNRRCVAAQEPGGGRMIELLRCIPLGPAGTTTAAALQR